ncbi:MAG: hypothetical protein FWD15_01975 [Alphaproteobacteria bacterium]|nr:hypothetical protein [Alphaproteobacteria bacterium]
MKLGNLLGTSGLIIFSCLLIGAGMWGCPKYGVYEQGLKGKAELELAKNTRKIKVQEAKAMKESAESLGAADTVQAHGWAKSNRIIGENLKENPEYLQWLYYENLSEITAKGTRVIYVPVETGIPSTEAGRIANAEYAGRITAAIQKSSGSR